MKQDASSFCYGYNAHDGFFPLPLKNDILQPFFVRVGIVLTVVSPPALGSQEGRLQDQATCREYVFHLEDSGQGFKRWFLCETDSTDLLLFDLSQNYQSPAKPFLMSQDPGMHAHHFGDFSAHLPIIDPPFPF
jgi:hypothetical protein